jgi:hypothetical protein
MKCSLNCFLDFLEAPTQEKRDSVVRQYKKQSTEEVKGMNTYYMPSIRAIKGTLCSDGNVDATLAAIREACIRPKCTDKLNDARIQSNVRVYRSFRSAFGNLPIVVFPSPRMPFLGPYGISVNMQPELLFEAEGKLQLLKLGLRRRPRKPETIEALLQMFFVAAHAKGIDLPLERVHFLETVTDSLFFDAEITDIKARLRRPCRDLAEKWEAA